MSERKKTIPLYLKKQKTPLFDRDDATFIILLTIGIILFLVGAIIAGAILTLISIAVLVISTRRYFGDFSLSLNDFE